MNVRPAVRAAALAGLVAGTWAALDIGYTLGVRGMWRSTGWLDRGHLSRVHNLEDPDLGFVRKSELAWRGRSIDGAQVSYRTDERGFRNPPGVRQAAIVFIGDSYTEGAQVQEQETFVGRLAQKTGLSVVNLGRGGYGPQQEGIVLERYGLDYQPRLVVWQIFDGNDLSDARIFERWRRDPDSVRLSLPARFFSRSMTRQVAKRLVGEPETGGAPARVHFTAGVTERIWVRYGYHPSAAGDRIAMAETMRALEEGARLCRARNASLLVVFVPTMLQVLRRDIAFERAADERAYLPAGPLDGADDFSRRLERHASEAGYGFVNALHPLREAALADNGGVFFMNDEHLDRRGHDIVAEAVVGWIAGSGHRLDGPGLPAARAGR